MSGYRKAQAFSISDLLCFELGINVSGLGLMIFHKMTPRTPHNYLITEPPSSQSYYILLNILLLMLLYY